MASLLEELLRGYGDRATAMGMFPAAGAQVASNVQSPSWWNASGSNLANQLSPPASVDQMPSWGMGLMPMGAVKHYGLPQQPGAAAPVGNIQELILRVNQLMEKAKGQNGMIRKEVEGGSMAGERLFK